MDAGVAGHAAVRCVREFQCGARPCRGAPAWDRAPAVPRIALLARRLDARALGVLSLPEWRAFRAKARDRLEAADGAEFPPGRRT